MTNGRIMCIDALRGFCMFWIIGGRELLAAVSELILGRVPGPLMYQITHPEWQGFTAWDLIMPLFLFLVGVALPFSLLRDRDHEISMIPIYFRIGRRVLLLWTLGIIFEGSLAQAFFSGNLHDIRIYSSALHAIAVGYLFTALAILHFEQRGRAVILSGILILFWGVLAFLPFAKNPAGTFQAANNFAQFLDAKILRGFDDHTPYTWILSSFGFTATVLLGAFAGQLLASERTTAKKLQLIVIAGFLLLILGFLSDHFHPINRRVWTSSMVLWAGGWSYLLLAFFYYVVDVKGWRRWAFPFTAIGSNAILAYMLGEQWVQTWIRLIGAGATNTLMEGIASLFALVSLFALLHVMYRNRIFLRV